MDLADLVPMFRSIWSLSIFLLLSLRLDTSLLTSADYLALDVVLCCLGYALGLLG